MIICCCCCVWGGNIRLMLMHSNYYYGNGCTDPCRRTAHIRVRRTYRSLLFGFNFYVHLIWLLIHLLMPLLLPKYEKAFSIRCAILCVSGKNPITTSLSVGIRYICFLFFFLYLNLVARVDIDVDNKLSPFPFRFEQRAFLFINFGSSAHTNTFTTNELPLSHSHIVSRE